MEFKYSKARLTRKKKSIRERFFETIFIGEKSIPFFKQNSFSLEKPFFLSIFISLFLEICFFWFYRFFLPFTRVFKVIPIHRYFRKCYKKNSASELNKNCIYPLPLGWFWKNFYTVTELFLIPDTFECAVSKDLLSKENSLKYHRKEYMW